MDYIYIIVVIFLAVLLIKELFYQKKTSKDGERRNALWFQELMKRFQERFPNQPFHIGESEPFVIVVPPKHPAVGGLRICDGGSNIIVEIGPFTHEHFDKTGMWDVEQSNWEDVREALVLDVLLFVEEVFEDKIEFYGGPRGGGHQERGQKTRGGGTTYVWSGPLEER